MREQVHGYRGGHRMLESSVRLDRRDQETIDRLSDIAGPLGPGERFAPYYTGYPLPSGQYYVLARTEQDLNAARAGCVLTHSIVIPQSDWESDNPVRYFAVLQEIPTMHKELALRHAFVLPTSLPEMSGPLLFELTEALFLETRLPTVVFETKEAPMIAIRLTTALWPKIRSSFSFCTFTLAPRSIDTRPFDLLFAPKTARSRFSEWPGRKLESGGASSTPRHRWTPLLEEKIFRSSSPSLIVESDSPVELDAKDAESGLRLTLLWEELKRKVPATPTAALGMIDIARSQSRLETSWRSLRPFVTLALQGVSSRGAPEEAWAFVAALANKIGPTMSADAIGTLLEITADQLVERDAASAIRFLASERVADGSFRESLYSALGKALGAREMGPVVEELHQLGAPKLLHLATSDSAMADRMFSSEALSERLIDAISSSTTDEKLHLMPALLPHLKQDWHRLALAALLDGVGSGAVVDTAAALWNVNRVRDKGIVDVLCRAAVASDAKYEVRELFNKGRADKMAMAAVSALLDPSPEDFMWLIGAGGVVGKHRAAFVAALVARASQHEVREIFRNEALLRYAVDTLLPHTQDHLRTILLLVRSGAADVNWKATTFLRMMDGAAPTSRAEITDQLRDLLTARVPSEPEVLRSALLATLPGLDLRRLIGASGDAQQLNDLILSLCDLPTEIGPAFLSQIAEIVEAISRKPRGCLSLEGASALADLLSRSSPDYERFASACSTALSMAMNAPNYPYSSLLVVAFPPIYDELKKDNDNLNMFRVFSFVDWDKCKIARNDLVRAFMRSTWPPGDLAAIALRTGDMNLIFDRISREYKGNAYLKKMRDALPSLNANDKRRIVKSIASALR